MYRLPNGKSVLDQFLASWPDLSAADREMLRRWRDPVDGIFEIRGRDSDSLILLNLVDDLEYRTYSNMGRSPSARCPKHGFVYARLVPIGSVPDAWLISGSMRAYRKSDAARIAEVALELATRLPELVYRNPEKVEQAWRQMRAETIGPLPLRRLAVAHPQTVDAVFRKSLRQPHFTWADHGEALMRRRKPWYFEHEPVPTVP